MKRITLIAVVVGGGLYLNKEISDYTSAPTNGRTYLFLSDRENGFNYSDKNRPIVHLTIPRGEKIWMAFGARDPDGIVRQDFFVNGLPLEEDKTPEGFEKPPIGLDASPRQLNIPFSKYTRGKDKRDYEITYQITDSKGYLSSTKAKITFQD